MKAFITSPVLPFRKGRVSPWPVGYEGSTWALWILAKMDSGRSVLRAGTAQCRPMFHSLAGLLLSRAS